MARNINKAMATIAAAALVAATATAVEAQAEAAAPEATIAQVATTAAAGIDAAIANLLATPAAQATETAEAPAPAATVPATAAQPTAPAAETEAPAEAEAEAVAAGPIAIDVNCTGTQDEIDTCVGATNYTPVADYLGVPYYAQHNGMGGEAWLALNPGDQVIADGHLYTIAEVRTVATGGDIDQIAGMGADAYLQTCLDDNIHSNVYALIAA